MGRNDIAQRQDMQIQQQNAAQQQQVFSDQQAALQEQRTAAAQQQAAAAAYQQDLMVLRDAAANGTLTPEMTNAFNLKYASNQAEIKTAFDAISEPKKAEQTQFGINLVTSLLSGHADVAEQMINERITAAENAGNAEEAAKLRANLKIVQMDPHAAAISIGTAMTSADAIKPDVWKSILEATQPLGQDFRPATPEEAAAYGAVAGQVNVKTGEFKAINPPTGFSVTTTPEGGTTITQGPGVGGADTGKRAQDYVYATDASGKQVAQPIAGTPAALQVAETAGKLDSAISVGNNMLGTIESIVGRPAGNGLTAIKPNEALPGILGLIEGRLPARTQAQADLLAKYDQVQGQAFLEAFSILKGAGAITEQEGTKATQAYARMQRTQSPEAFTQSMNEFADIVRLGIKRAQDQKMSLPQVAAGTPESSGLPQSFLSDQSAIDAAKNAGVTLQDMWNIMTPANKARYGK